MSSPTKDTNPKDALGCKKPPMSTVPCPVLFEIGAAMLEGAAKYRRHNYRVSGVRMSVYYDAALRHLMAWWEGEDIDPESGLHHVSKAIAGLVVLRDAMMNDMVSDDRPPCAKAGWLAKVQDQVSDLLRRHPHPLAPYTREEVERPSDRAFSEEARRIAARIRREDAAYEEDFDLEQQDEGR